jgi:hypothetical protein
MAMHRSELKVADGKIPINPNLRLVDEHVRKTVHRFDPVLRILHFGEVHLVPIILEMA